MCLDFQEQEIQRKRCSVINECFNNLSFDIGDKISCLSFRVVYRISVDKIISF